MPDGARNGISADKNSDFLCDEEDEEDENEALNKSFNLSFIFDLFRAAMDGKIGDKNGNSSPRLSKGPKDSDYVMLVLNQNQKEDADIAILIDRLRQNGVTCIFFTRNDIRNGTIKPPPEIPEFTKAKQIGVRNPKTHLEQSLIDNEITSPSGIDPLSPSLPNCNGVTPNTIHTLSIPLDLISDKGSILQNPNNHSKPITVSSLSPLPPLLSPQIEISDNLRNTANDPIDTPSYSQDEGSSVFVPISSKEPTVRKKRRRKRRYPYLARKPTKKRNIWKGLEKDASPAQITQSENDVKKIVPVSVTPDPYAFMLDEIEEPVIERPYTPKKSRVNGLTKDCKSSGLTSVVKVNGEISKDNLDESNLASISPEINISDPRAFSPDIVTETVDSRSRIRTQTAASKKRTSKSKSKVQRKNKLCVHSISDDIEVKIIDESVPSDLPINEKSAPAQDTLKQEVIDAPPLAIPLPSPSSSNIEVVSLASLSESQSEDVAAKEVTESTNSAQIHQVDIKIKLEAGVVDKKDGDGGPPMSEESFMDAMQLRRPSFYSQIAGNVRNNMEHHLDGRMTEVKVPKRRKRARNGFLLHHGDNFPEDPEAPYKLHLATQIILKLNKRRSKFKPKEDKGKSLLSYLKLVPKRSSRAGKGSTNLQPPQEALTAPQGQTPVFSGEWTQERMFVCNICGHIEDYFWNMVTHKGEIHPGIVVTHVELPDLPPVGFRFPPKNPATSTLPSPPPCTKCSATFSNYPDLHRHIFECAGNASWLEEKKPPQTPRKKPKKKRGFKRRLSNTPRKVSPKKTDTPKRRNSEVFKCEFCTREFKTEGWLKNHLVTHSLPISIPLSKLTLPPRASFNPSRRSCVQNLIAKA